MREEKRFRIAIFGALALCRRAFVILIVRKIEYLCRTNLKKQDFYDHIRPTTQCVGARASAEGVSLT